MAVYRQSKKDKQKQFDNIRKKTKFITDEYGYFMKKEKMSLPSKILLSSIAANIICFIVLYGLLYFLEVNGGVASRNSASEMISGLPISTSASFFISSFSKCSISSKKFFVTNLFFVRPISERIKKSLIERNVYYERLFKQKYEGGENVEKVEELYKTYFHDVYLFMVSVTGNEDLSQDLTQETFFKAMKSIDGFRGECSVRSWLCQIAKNLYITHCRKNKKIDTDTEPESLTDDSISLEDRFDDKQQAVQIHRILHGIEEPYKEVFSLRVFSELSFKQIADIFGKTESWARVTFYRAKVKIVEQMGE